MSPNEYMLVGKSQWIEIQLAIGKYPQGMSLVEYVRRVPKGPK